MKPLKYLVAFLLCSSFIWTSAQDNLEDVVYLKNGSIYRGLIIEQVPGESLKIQIAGGSVIVVQITEVQKMTKEQRWQTSVPERVITTTPVPQVQRSTDSRGRAVRDSSFIPHYKKKRTYFFLGELRAGPGNGGVRIVNGFKFGRFGYLGVGVGIDGATFSQMPFGPTMYEQNNYNDGVYLPLYIRYSGDIIRKRITPFYYIEAGYAAHPVGVFQGPSDVRSYGGPMGAVGFGCKFNTNRRINFNVNINANWKSNFYSGYVMNYNPNGYPNSQYVDGMEGQLFGCIGFGIGF